MSLEVIRSTHVAYGFTLKINQPADKVTHSMYDPWFTKAQGYDCIIECKYAEKDKDGRIHYHGIIQIKKGFFRKKLAKLIPNLHLKLEEIYDYAGWLAYCKKDQPKRLQSSLFRYNKEGNLEKVSETIMAPTDDEQLVLTKRIV